MTITISVPDQLALQAAGHGLSVEAFVEQLAEQAANPPVSTAAHDCSGRPNVAAAVDHIRASRRVLTLGGGLRSKDLAHEGHKY